MMIARVGKGYKERRNEKSFPVLSLPLVLMQGKTLTGTVQSRRSSATANNLLP